MTNLIEPCIVKEGTKLYIYGAGGHGKVVAETALALGHLVSGFIDDDPSMVEWLVRNARRSKLVVGLGIGDNRERYRIAQQCRRLDVPLVTLVHPSAHISPSAAIGNGTVVMAMVVVNAEARIGSGVILNTGVIVEHDCLVGEYAHLSPNSTMGGASSLGMMSWLGIGATIIHQVSVGGGSVVGAGAVVIQDLPDTVVAVGVPARICHRAVHT
jgi:sugar O-acyltransferase (sialic acid O-acetyltransferase NeuD family)